MDCDASGVPQLIAAGLCVPVALTPSNLDVRPTEAVR